MMLYECTDHESFDRLRDQLQQVLIAVTEVGRPSGIRDVSLQYVDEIRYPGATTPGDWQTLVAPAAVGPTNLLDVPMLSRLQESRYMSCRLTSRF